MKVGDRPDPNVPSYMESNSDIDSDDSASVSSTTSRSSINAVKKDSEESSKHTPTTNKSSQGRKWNPNIDFRRLGVQLSSVILLSSNFVKERISSFLMYVRESWPWAQAKSYDLMIDNTSESLDREDSISIDSFHSVDSHISMDETYPVYTQEQLQQAIQEGVKNLVHSKPYISGGPSIKFHDQLGGHGDVGFLQGTNVVFKQNLITQEAKTYKLLNELQAWLQDPQASPSNIPESLKGISSSESKQLLDTKELLLKSLPFPMAMAENEGSVAVAIKNINMVQTSDGSFRKVSSKGVIDIKLGHKTMSIQELKAHYPEKARGLPLFRKIITNGVLPMLCGTSTRGYEVVPQSKGMKRLFMARQESDNLINYLSKRLTVPQAENLFSQINDLSEAMRILPITFVGSSMLIALPDSDDTETMPQVGLADFGHPVYQNEASPEGPITEQVFRGLKQNYMNAVNSLSFYIKGIANNSTLGDSQATST